MSNGLPVAPKINSGRKSILVVDDLVDVREVYQTRLEMEGFKVEVAADGKQALDAISRRAFDAVLTDMWMPNMTGAELIHEIREHPSISGIPVILMSAIGVDAIYKEAGADLFLAKPFPFETLKKHLENLGLYS